MSRHTHGNTLPMRTDEDQCVFGETSQRGLKMLQRSNVA